MQKVEARLGPVQHKARTNTSVADHNTYDAYGYKISQTDAAHDVLFAYTGRLLDVRDRFQFNGNRWYDTTTRRWLSEDPLGLAGGTNLTEYAGDSPTNFTDPTGLLTWEATAAPHQQPPRVRPWHAAPVSPWDAFWDSIGRSLRSGQEALVGDPNAYADSPYGQATGGYKTGVKVALGVSVGATVVAGGLMAAGADPWLGTFGIHGAHHGMGPHAELILRAGPSRVFKLIVPGKDGLIWWGLK